jgi:hypothetical protein
MMLSKTSCMPSFKKVGTMYGKNDGTHLCQEFHYKLIFTWPKKTKTSLPMWWLLTWHGRWWLRVSLVDQQVQLWNCTIAKICKYRRLHERHRFISMAMEVHIAPNRDMDHFIKECAHLFHNKWLRGHLFLSFCIQFFNQHVNIVLQHALASTIERKIMLLSDASYKPPLLLDLMICMQVTLEGLWVR